jgi:SAM-dependent methyltransferase
MDEASKTRSLWNATELSFLKGSGIDIGAGPDAVTADVERFDIEHGDANEITKFVHKKFDFVFSSHCLEHMHKPYEAILEWWQLVKPGGILFFLVPDEDLYEQGVFPSRFNPDHKATFTISKRSSWSRVSINVIDLVKSLPSSEVISIQLHDVEYDRSRQVFGPATLSVSQRATRKLYRTMGGGIRWKSRWLESTFPQPVDQTLTGALAQIQVIVRKQILS